MEKLLYTVMKNHCLFIDFKDNGEGIKEDALKDIFNPSIQQNQLVRNWFRFIYYL